MHIYFICGEIERLRKCDPVARGCVYVTSCSGANYHKRSLSPPSRQMRCKSWAVWCHLHPTGSSPITKRAGPDKQEENNNDVSVHVSIRSARFVERNRARGVWRSQIVSADKVEFRTSLARNGNYPCHVRDSFANFLRRCFNFRLIIIRTCLNPGWYTAYTVRFEREKIGSSWQ